MSDRRAPEGGGRFAELMRSPLEPGETRRRDRGRNPAGLFIAWLLAGAVVGTIGWGLVDGGGDDPTTTTSFGTTAAPAAPVAGFAPGFVDLGDTGLAALAAEAGGDRYLVLLAEAVRTDMEITDVVPLETARLELELDRGRPLRATRVYTEFPPTGLRMAEFPALPLGATPESLRVWEASDITVRASCSGCGTTAEDRTGDHFDLEGQAPPIESDERRVLELGDGLGIVIDRIVVADEYGAVDWHLEGPDDFTARLVVDITFVGTDDPGSPDVIDPTHLITVSQAPRFFAEIAPSTDAFQRSGQSILRRVGEPLGGSNQATGLVVDWSAEWHHPVGEPITIPLGQGTLYDFAGRAGR